MNISDLGSASAIIIALGSTWVVIRRAKTDRDSVIVTSAGVVVTASERAVIVQREVLEDLQASAKASRDECKELRSLIRTERDDCDQRIAALEEQYQQLWTSVHRDRRKRPGEEGPSGERRRRDDDAPERGE